MYFRTLETAASCHFWHTWSYRLMDRARSPTCCVEKVLVRGQLASYITHRLIKGPSLDKIHLGLVSLYHSLEPERHTRMWSVKNPAAVKLTRGPKGVPRMVHKFTKALVTPCDLMTARIGVHWMRRGHLVTFCVQWSGSPAVNIFELILNTRNLSMKE